MAILTDEEGARIVGDAGVPLLVLENPRTVLGTLAARLYGEPAHSLTLMAVTGTQGKTTTTRLLEGALDAAGVQAAVIGTVGTRIAGRDVKTALTTPEAPDLHALFAVMVEQGVTACAMEVSSHALVMGRVAGVVFDVAAFLNLGRDHLDFHKDIDDYFAAKASLFTPERTRRGLTNVDDVFGRRLLEEATSKTTPATRPMTSAWLETSMAQAATWCYTHHGEQCMQFRSASNVVSAVFTSGPATLVPTVPITAAGLPGRPARPRGDGWWWSCPGCR